MQERLDTPLSPRGGGARRRPRTRRGLALLFRRYRELSPGEVLRNMRLDAAHAQLARHDGASVTEVALNCGFAPEPLRGLLPRALATCRARPRGIEARDQDDFIAHCAAVVSW